MTTIPTTFRLAYAGALGVPLLVIAAVAVRSPVFPDDGGVAPSASAADDASSSRPTSSASTRPDRSAVPLLSALRPVISPTGPSTGGTHPIGDSSEARAGLEDLRKMLRFNNLTGALQSLKALMAIDSDVANDARPEIVDLTQRIMGLKGSEPDEMFDLLVNKMGTGGIDVLYEMVTTKGGSDAAVQSKKLLDKPDVLALGSPAVQVAYKLREAAQNGGCDAIKALFPDIREHGDGRSLGQLYILGRRCSRRHVGPCCLAGDADLDETVKALQARGYQ